MKNRLLFLQLIVLTLFTFHAATAQVKTKLNFNDVEVLSVIKLMSQATGRTFVFNNNILKGKKITLLSNQQFTPKEAYRIFEAVLAINGLSTIEEGKVTRIVTRKEAKTSTAPIYKEESKVNQGSYITRVIPILHGQIRKIRSNLAPLISRDAVLIAIEDSNVLILRDTKENTERFAEIVRLIDREEKGFRMLNLELVPLKNADANETAGLLQKIFATPVKKGQEAKLRILADQRINNLILIGPPPFLEKIKELIVLLDEKIQKDEGNIRVYPLKSANAKSVSEVLQKISGTFKAKNQKGATTTDKVTIIPDIPSNSLVIFADKSIFPALENVINKLDIQRAQVFIQAIIMEVTLDKSLDLGVEWQASDIQPINSRDSLVTIGGVGSTGVPKTLSAATQSTDSAGAVLGVIGGNITYGGTQYASLNAFVKASEKDSEIDILSNPQILTLNNEEAEIKVGSIIPTIGSTKTDTNGNTTTTIDYKEVGVSLKITPQINNNDTIELKIDETTSNVITGTVDALSDQGAITTLNRSLKTKVVVEDGQTIVLGGLVSDDVTEQEIKTPCLGDIPIIGWLFKTYSSTTRKTNLLVFLTPKVIRDESDMEEVSEKSKEKFKSAQEGRFRIDVSKEFNLPVTTGDDDESEENPQGSE
ncbi:MAG: type II secretion system secretin GspD [Proteobacteria bacterium]|nr:type II secretion system secretin GspD [Pseudomonadota bacterium]